VQDENKIKISLKAARVNAGHTQESAAQEIGVTRTVVGNWERHKTYPDAAVIPIIERVYGIKYEDIKFLP
jgi:putative transcriptional regulator